MFFIFKLYGVLSIFPCQIGIIMPKKITDNINPSGKFGGFTEKDIASMHMDAINSTILN